MHEIAEREMGNYATEWFYQRALNGLKRRADGVWDYSDSLLLYTPGTESEYEFIQDYENPYSKLVTQPEIEYLKETADQIVNQLPQEFEYIDLGPGTAHKEQYVFDAAKKADKQFIYRPVDISQYYLNKAENYAVKQSLKVFPIRSAFEDLPAKLGAPQIPRFVSLGLTFTNYEPQKAFHLMKTIAGPQGCVFINSQIRNRVDMAKIVSIYANDTQAIINPKLKLLGLNPDADITDRIADDGVRVWCTIKNLNSALQAKGVAAGDKFLIFQSLRYTKDSLEKEIKKTNLPYTLFDTRKSFIGASIKTV